MVNSFAVLILSHGRADRVYTYEQLRRNGYTGKIYIVIDDSDQTAADYHEKYGSQVVVFSKADVANTFDVGDNLEELRGVVYARNACFGIAEQLGLKYFIVLDDDHASFEWRSDHNYQYVSYKQIKDLDRVFEIMLEFFKVSGCLAFAFAQGGDYVGGAASSSGRELGLKRKAMGSFICSTDRPFKFVGRINEDTNTYVLEASKGQLIFTTVAVMLGTKQTQKNAGGLTDMYLDDGTYVKTFYSLIFNPSSVKLSLLESKNHRIHHRVSWRKATPKIIRECHKKALP